MLDEIHDVQTASTTGPAPAPAGQRRISARMTIAAVTVGLLVLGAGGTFGYRTYAHGQDVKAVNAANAAFTATSTSLEETVERANSASAAAESVIASNPATAIHEILNSSNEVRVHLVEIASLLATNTTVDAETFTGDMTYAAQSLTEATATLGSAEEDLKAAVLDLEATLAAWEAAELEQAKTTFTSETAALTAILTDARALLASSEGVVTDNETRVALAAAIEAVSEAVAVIPEETVASYRSLSAASQTATQTLGAASQGVQASQEAFTAQKAAEAQAAADKAAALKAAGSTKSHQSAGTPTGTSKSSTSTGSSSGTPSGTKYIIGNDGRTYVLPDQWCGYVDCIYVGQSN